MTRRRQNFFLFGLRWAVLSTALLILSSPARPETLKLLPSDQDRLLRGDVLVNFKPAGDSNISLVQGQIMYDAPPAVVWSALIDYPAYPRFFTDMNTIKVVDSNEQSARIKVETENYWPYPDLHYTLRMAPSIATWTLSWKMEEGNLKTLYGTCKLFQLPGQVDKTVAVYSLVQDPGWLVPDITSEMGNRSLVIERLLGLRQEVRNRRKQPASAEIRPQWHKVLFWWEKQPDPDPTMDELFNPHFDPAPPPPKK